MEKSDHKIPFRYDYEDSGFHMDYVPRIHNPAPAYPNSPTVGQTCQLVRDSAMLAPAHACRKADRSNANVALLEYSTHRRVVLGHLGKRCYNGHMTRQVIHAQGNEFKTPGTTHRDHRESAIWAHHQMIEKCEGQKRICVLESVRGIAKIPWRPRPHWQRLPRLRNLQNCQRQHASHHETLQYDA